MSYKLEYKFTPSVVIKTLILKSARSKKPYLDLGLHVCTSTVLLWNFRCHEGYQHSIFFINI